MSPLDIYNKEFNKSMRGYDTAEVDDFIEDVGLAYEKMFKRMNALREEKGNLQEQLDNYKSIQQELKDTLRTIQDTAEKHTRNAREEADLIIEKAKQEAEEIKQRAREDIREEKKEFAELRDTKKLFEVRFKNMLLSFLKMMDEKHDEENRDVDKVIAGVEEEIEQARSDDTGELDE
ncbi:MAG: DivIVA domain-containing protein [Halanaerobiaceae bacterium]